MHAFLRTLLTFLAAAIIAFSSSAQTKTSSANANADLALVNGRIIDPLKIHESRVVLTIFDGKVIYRNQALFADTK